MEVEVASLQKHRANDALVSAAPLLQALLQAPLLLPSILGLSLPHVAE